MKALLVIFAIFINYVICNNNKYAVKSFPKKVKPYGNGKILINSGKYEFKTKLPKTTTKETKRTYTVFQVVGHSQAVRGVPDSPYFPVDQSIDQKPRVKKVLPDYAWVSLRNKRSAILEPPTDEKKVEIATTKNTPEPKIEIKVETTPVIKPDKTTEEPKVERKSAPLLKKRSATVTSEENTSNTKEHPKEKAKEHTKEHAKETAIIETPDKPIERSGIEKSNTEPEKADLKAGKIDSTSNKKPELKSDNDDTQNKDTSKTQLRTDKRTGNRPATNIKVKPKSKRTAAHVANIRSSKKKNGTISKTQKRAGKRKQGKKPKARKGLPQGRTSNKTKGRKVSPQRSKNQVRSKKGQKIKRTNATRTGIKPKGKPITKKIKRNNNRNKKINR